MSHLESRRVWLVGSAVIAVLIMMVGWFGLISPKMSSTSSLHDQAANVEQQNLVLQAKVRKLKKESEKLNELTASLNTVLLALPTDSGLPAFTRQLTGQAAQNQVVLTGITVGSITTPNKTGAANPSGTSAAGQIFAIPVILTSDGSALHQLAFLKTLQTDGPRRALIGTTQLKPKAGGPTESVEAACTMTTQVTVFTAPLSPQEQAQIKKLLNGDVSN